MDVVDPFWQVSNVNIDHSKNQVTMTIKGTDKYYSGNSLTKDKITVLVDGETATSVTKTLSSATSITKGVQYTLTLTTWQQSSKQSGKSYLEWSGNTVIRIAAGTLTDSNGNSSKQQDFSIGLVDFIKPTITKVSATKDAANKKETIVFDVDDKYINSTMISADNIKVYMNGVEATSITKSLSRTAKTGTVNKVSKTVGYKYTLVLTNFEQSTYQTNKEYKEWSGTVSIKIVANATKDTSNNGNVDTTITGDFVDFIKPQWRLVGSPTIDHTNNRVVMTIKGTDKYFKATTLATSNIKVYVDGTEATSVTKNLSAATDVKEGSTKVGVQYTLTLTGWEQSSKQNGKSYFEWSGNTVVKIAAGVLTDTSSNSSPETSFTIGQVDFIKPKIEKVSSSKSGGTETITFKVIDKYFNTSAKLTKDDITVLVDSETASSVSKTLSNPTEIKETVNGASKVIGHQYTMTLTNFEKTRTTIDRNREYSDWSGTVAIKVAAGKVKDTSNNTNAETTITGDFLDVIKPNVTYQFSESNIDKNGKRFTMVFDITDKYYNASTSTTLSVNDLTIKIDGAVPDWNKVTRNLTVADYSNTVYYTSNGAIKHESKVIGKRYTLTLSNLQQSSIAANASYKDYSGVVTVAIPANKVADTTGNKNNAVTITSGVNIPTNSGTGKVVDVVDPFWQVSNVNINHSTNQVTMTIKGTDKYYKASTLSRDNITVLVDGETATSVTKTLSSATSITNGVQYTLTLTTWQQSSKQSGKSYLEWSGNTKIRIAAGTMTDTNGNSSKQQDFSIGLVDFIKPTITKVSSTKDATNKRETIVFDVDDKYINTTSISTDNIKVYMNGVEATSITKNLSRTAKTGTVNGASKTIGYKYTLVLTNFEQSTYQTNKEYKEWSGTVSIKIVANATKDTSNNGNVDTTITGDFVDFIKPQWRLVGSPTIDHTNNRVVMTIKGTDKYFKATTLATSNIKVYVDGTEATSVTKNLSAATDVKEGSTKVGVQYTLTLTGWEQSSKQNGKSYFEWSGNTVVKIAAGVLTDTSSNSSPETSFTIGQVDFIKPKIEKVSSSKSGGTETITFKVIDKYFNTSAKLTKDDITVLVDSETASSVSKTLSNPTEIKETVNGASKVIGHQYTMTLTNFEKTRTTIDRNREYSDWSGTVAIKVAAGKVKDTSNNTNAETTITGDFLDVIKPNVTYQFSESNIDKNGKRFTMVFDITDKYYNASTSTTLSVNDLTIKIDGAVPDWNKVTRNLTVADYSNTVYYTSNGAIKHESKVIGKRYTLTLSNLQQSSIAANASYKDYSGVVTVAIPANKVADTTGNKNNAVTITSGVNIPTNSGTGKVVDVVDPFWQVSNVNINHSTNQVTMTIKGTDKYYKASTLSRDNITVLVDGETATSVTKTLSSATSITNGVQYTLTLTTWQQSSKQSGKSYLEWSGNTKIRIAAGTMTDTNGNSSKQQDFSIGLVDFIKPTITKVSSTKDATNKRETIVFDVDDKYINTTSISTDNIKVYMNGVEATSITKNLSRTAKTGTVNGASKTIGYKYTLVLTNFEQSTYQTNKEYKEWSGTVSLRIAADAVQDTSQNKNNATTITGDFVDFIKPEFTYVYADSDINHTTKTLTAVFKVADKYRASTAFTKKSDGTYDASSITVGIDSYDKTTLNNAISKKLTLESERTEEISGQNRVTVQTYKLVIGNLEQKGQGGLSDGYTYSGILTLGFPEGTITDTSGHKSPATTITIGKNEPGGTGTGKPVDVVDPVWSVVSTNADTGVVKLRVKDKYLTKSTSKFNLVKDSIKIIVNGVESTAIVKTLEGPTTIIDGQEYEYTLTLSNIAPSGGGYTEFTPLETIVGGTAKYRNDNGGSIAIRIPAGVVTDANGNKTKQQDLNVGNMDLTEPEVYFVQKNRDLANNQETIIFNVTDKNYDSTKLIAANELTTWVDGIQMDSKLTKSISSKTISTRIDGSTRVVGHQYTLVLKGFAESDSAFASSGRVYREYSGNLQVKINKDAARDKRGNTLNSSTTTIAQFTDVVRPDIKAKWSDAVINKNNKTFTMIFDVTDEYYSTSTLAIENLTIEIGGKTPDWSSNGVGRSLSVSDIPGGVGKGKRYTLTLSNLQALQIKSGDKYLDYSGVVTVAIPANKVKDTTGNTNLAKTITSGITIPGGTGSAKEVDVVDPYVQKMSSTVNAVAKTASITVRISDRYFNKSTLTKDTIEVYINGTKNSAVKTGWSTSEETESRTEKGTTSTVHVATNYTLNISGFDSNINQIKVVVPANVVKDTSENGNKQTEYIIYNVLRKQDDRGEDDTAPFFGNTTVPREDIDNVTFVSSTAGKNSTKWDVSAQGDSSILAWYTKNSNGTFKVYVGSDYEIFGNTDSSYLFRSVGLSENCTSTETITNINLLNVSSVTNMYRMFERTGNQAMTKLDLGDNFNTSNVTNMFGMFSGTGQKAMTTLNLGSNFNTSRVTEMSYMFSNMGFYKMISLELGNNFDTSNVTNMAYMFNQTGWNLMTSLDLSNKFNTSKVTSMKMMFGGTGYESMTSLDLGSKFNTSKVTDMSYMFYACGYNALTSLDLGSNFDTSKVTNMSSMFYGTGLTSMTSLNLGDKFDTSNVTNMNEMFIYCGGNAMTQLNLGTKFDTSKVTTMASMFGATGSMAMTSLDLGDKFDTSNVEDMSWMFSDCGREAMTTLNLGNKFNTSKVKNMLGMFNRTGNKQMTKLDLGDLFYTTNVEDMAIMFRATGGYQMTELDLGPAFTNIPNAIITGGIQEENIGDTHSANYKIFDLAGKDGAITIHAPESIFQDKNNFKLNASATTGTVNYTRGTINPKYRTEWKKEKVVLDQANDNIKITLRGTTNTSVAENEYISDVTSSLALNKIKVLIDGTDITSTVLNAQGIGNATQTTENSRTGAKDVLQTITLTNFAKAAKRLNGKKYKEWSGNITIEIAQGTLSEKYGNKNMLVATDGTRTVSTVKETNKVSKNTANTMFTDYIKPEFTYSSITDTNIVHGTGRKVEVMFDVTDKYFESTKLSNLNASQITIGMDDYDQTELNKAITKKLEKVGTITDTVNGVSNVTVGERYKLTITGLEQQNEKGLSDGYTYSGYMSLKFAKGTIKDKSGNLSDATTITIGKNEPGGSDTDKTVVDIVDPVWTLGDVDANDGTIKLRVKDKFLIKDRSKFELTTDKITIYADDVVSTEIEKQISGPVEIRANEEYEYTLTLLNIKPDGDEYEEFTPKNPIVGGTAKYKKENGGDIMIKIAAGAVTDAYGNKTKEQIIDPGNIDGTGPEVYDIQKTKDATNNKETFVFNVTDKNYDSKDLVTIDELTVWLDGKQVDIDGEITKKFITNPVAKIDTPVEIITTVNGQERVVGHQYTLEIGSIVETNAEFVASNRKYRELSGTLEIKIATDAAKDKKGNKINPDTATITDFNDMIKPEVIYKYATSNIDKTNKIFKMEFDLVDKYCKAINNIALTDLTIQIDGKVPDWTKVTRNLEFSDIKESVNGTNKLIGRHYTLTLSNLEQLQVKSGDNYLDYSGVITVAIPANKMQDTAGNQNVTTTITSGVSIPAGTGSDTIVDVVDPLIEKISSTVDAPTKTATLNFKVTDKYFASSDLAKGNIEILVNGAKNTTVAANNALTVVKNLTEPRTVDGKTVQVQYGIEYSLKISGFDANANQIKVRFPEKHVKDKSGNVNKQTDIMIYNVLRSAATETEVTNPFLGNTKVLRQNVDKVTFMSNIPDSVMDKSKNTFKNTNAWDVSAMQDKSIIAWYNSNEVKNGTYKVYIGSDTEIFGNTDSTNLFRNVGHSDKSTSTETITNISLLNTGSVTNMSWMFGFTGYNKMTKLELGDNFDTKNVTNMEAMFGETGRIAMTKLDLGTKFNTSNVTNMGAMFSNAGMQAMTTFNLGSNFNTGKVLYMQYMFNCTGYEKLITLNLGSNFDTSKVTNMSGMFASTGHELMTTLDLGANFNTSAVTDMSSMFEATGYKKMIKLNLREKFNTSKVTNMSKMFKNVGFTAMTSLDLGNTFYTTAVTDTSEMFNNTGATAMTILDLGPAFDRIPDTNTDMFKNTGTAALVVYAPESIYSNVTTFIANRTRN